MQKLPVDQHNPILRFPSNQRFTYAKGWNFEILNYDPQGRFDVPKVRAFVDFATPRLKRYFERLSRKASRASRSRRGRVSAE